MQEMALELQNLTHVYGKFHALSDVSLSLPAGKIYGLLGRNGAGKTTMMSILAAQIFQTSGKALVFGQSPHENTGALKKLCYIREKGPFPKAMRVREALDICAGLYPNWNAEYARSLADGFGLSLKKKYKQLSRGMESSLGLTIGLASRAELTVFDEPSLGLDAVARERFYSELIRDIESHPRTVIISTHLIDEVSQLFEDVIIINRGRVLSYSPLSELLETACMLTGPAAAVEALAAPYKTLHEETLAGMCVRTVLLGGNPPPEEAEGVKVSPVPLQKLFVYLTEEGK